MTSRLWRNCNVKQLGHLHTNMVSHGFSSFSVYFWQVTHDLGLAAPAQTQNLQKEIQSVWVRPLEIKPLLSKQGIVVGPSFTLTFLSKSQSQQNYWQHRLNKSKLMGWGIFFRYYEITYAQRNTAMKALLFARYSWFTSSRNILYFLNSFWPFPTRCVGICRGWPSGWAHSGRQPALKEQPGRMHSWSKQG